MKILITTGIFKPELGGPATFALEFAKRLKATGHTVAVITYSDKLAYDFDAENGFPIIRIVRSQKKFSNYFRYFLAVWRNAKNYSFIYSLDWFSAGVPMMLATRFTRTKYVVRVGGGYIWEKYLAEGKPAVTLKEFYEKGLHHEYGFMFRLIKRVFERAAIVVFNTDEQRELYSKYYSLNPKRITTITNAVPEHKFSSLMNTYNELERMPDKEIVFAGRFIKMKNVESLIRAFAKLRDQEYKLLLIGEGPTEALLRAIVHELKLEKRVEFLAPLSQRDLYRRITNCAYVVIPSWTDVSPHQVYECLSLGIPFLLTQENYLSINNKDFLKIDPHSVDDIAEKMNRLLVSNEYQNFVRTLRSIEYKHSWNDVVAEYLKIFKYLV
jgi:glycosyltransferase involved in cell wall biosynthesis